MDRTGEILLLVLLAFAISDVAYAPLDACLAPRMCRPVNRCCFPRDGDCPAGRVCCQMWKLR